jgi:hypothetical protein
MLKYMQQLLCSACLHILHIYLANVPLVTSLDLICLGCGVNTFQMKGFLKMPVMQISGGNSVTWSGPRPHRRAMDPEGCGGGALGGPAELSFGKELLTSTGSDL